LRIGSIEVSLTDDRRIRAVDNDQVQMREEGATSALAMRERRLPSISTKRLIQSQLKRGVIAG
jgi:hypothetical protein